MHLVQQTYHCGYSRVMRWFTLLITFCYVNTFCTQQRSDLLHVTHRQSGILPKFQEVIDYYSTSPADSLKLLACKYLITNMSGHFGYEGDGLEDNGTAGAYKGSVSFYGSSEYAWALGGIFLLSSIASFFMQEKIVLWEFLYAAGILFSLQTLQKKKAAMVCLICLLTVTLWIALSKGESLWFYTLVVTFLISLCTGVNVYRHKPSYSTTDES